MDQILPLITGSAGALVVLALWVYAFYTGKLHSDNEFRKLETENEALRSENGSLRSALGDERKAVNETAAAGQVTNQLIAALAGLAAEKAGRKPKGPGPELIARDLGI